MSDAIASKSILVIVSGLGAVILTASAFLLLGSGGTQAAPGDTASTALKTFAGIPPVAYLVKRIGGPHVRVEVLVNPGQDPHVFEPTPRQVMRLSKARLFFKVGMPFEDRLTQRVAAGDGRILMVDTAEGIKRRVEHDSCAGDQDEDEGPDPHVWLAPRLLQQMAANIAAALCQADPQHEQDFRRNLAVLNGDLEALDRRLAASLAPYRGEAFYVFHPAFGYFADAYGLRQESVEVEGKSPTPRQLYRMIQKARAEHVKIIFLQPQFNQQAAASIAQALDGAVKPMDSLAFDALANLDDVGRSIESALGKVGPASLRAQVQPCLALTLASVRPEPTQASGLNDRPWRPVPHDDAGRNCEPGPIANRVHQ